MFFGWKVVGGAAVAQLFVIGFFSYTFSLLVMPLRNEFGASLEQVMYSMTLCTLVGMFMSPLAGAMIDRYPVRWLMIGGAGIYAAGMWLLAQASSITMFSVIFGAFVGLGNAFVGPMPANAAISRWFTASRGKALGFSAIGTSVGGMLLPVLFTWWIADFGWRGALQNFAASIVLVLIPIMWWTIYGKPEDKGLQAEGLDSPQPTALPDEQAMQTMDILRQPAFWLIAASLGLLLATYGAILANLTPYATSLGRSDGQASSLLMTIAVAGLTGKIIFGIAADKFSLKFGLGIAHVLVAVGFLMLSTKPEYTGMLAACASIGLAAGGMLPVWASMLAQVFGVSSFGRAMGMMGPVITLIVMPSFVIVGRVVDTTGSYTLLLQGFAGVLAIAILLLLPLRMERAG
ncbi:MFS transporter [Halieaceae bacterium IMCC14734]|uniref:MFS transporter n=1 Tax=Candidatus Litorirhabdus singularis TaxID=2518993 RepID=A0ABT3TEN1_9GAMM|nr:MFS transporter [Candidatus Litorirhabdus singularis]MCX2980771.1 MFS transporter [Candidatus Litorirhabdus singularis]